MMSLSAVSELRMQRGKMAQGGNWFSRNHPAELLELRGVNYEVSFEITLLVLKNSVIFIGI